LAARLLQKSDQLERYVMQTVEEWPSFRLLHRELVNISQDSFVFSTLPT